MKQRPTLVTERLVLRPFDLSDAGRVQELAGDWAIAEMTLEIPHPYEDGMAEQWISSHQPRFEEGNLLNFAVTLRESAELIGAVGLGLTTRFERAEIGYWIGKPYWNRGYCTEAGAAVVEYGFTTLGLNRIFASHYARNPASGRVMIKLGMKPEGLLRRHLKRWDRFEDMVVYAILKEEWRAAHGGIS